MTFILAIGQFDLSVGATYGFGGIITGYMIAVLQMPWPIAVVAGLLMGACIGWLNGTIITRFDIPPFIVTLGMMYIVRGIINVMTQGKPYTGFPESFKLLGTGTLAGIPYSVYIALIILLLSHYIFRYTTYGRCILAVGGNTETARVCGLNIRRIQVSVYVLAGVLSAFVGIISASRLSTAQASAGDGWEMTVIASAVIGGTSLFGGNATVLGTLIGVAIMEVLTVATTLLKIDAYYQRIIVGVIIILAVGIDTMRRKKVARG